MSTHRTFGSLTRRFLGVATLLVAGLAAASQSRADMVWAGPSPITGDSDVVATGTLVGAFNLEGADTTINGVTFLGASPAAFPFTLSSPASPGVSFAFTSATPSIAIITTGSTNDVGGLSSSYQSLIAAALGANGNDQSMTLTISGLTIGDTYVFEFWRNVNSTSGTTATDGTSVTLTKPETLGQYAVGTFAATGSSESIVFSPRDGSSINYVNGFQLRSLTQQAVVPEPVNLAFPVFVAVFAGMGLWRRNRSGSQPASLSA